MHFDTSSADARNIVPDGRLDSASRRALAFSVDGIVVNIASPSALLDEVRARLTSGEGASVATMNLDHLVKLKKDAAFREAYLAHDLVTADGFPIVLAGRLQRRRIVRTAGSDLVLPLCQLAAELDCSIVLLGSTEQILAEASHRLREKIPHLRIAHTLSPSFQCRPSETEVAEIVKSLRGTGARMWFLALGAPKQELFAALARKYMPEVCLISVGAGIDFISGHQRRAPKVMQQLQLEWLWRIIQDPQRMTVRYIRCGLTVPHLFLHSLANRWLSHPASELQ